MENNEPRTQIKIADKVYNVWHLLAAIGAVLLILLLIETNSSFSKKSTGYWPDGSAADSWGQSSLTFYDESEMRAAQYHFRINEDEVCRTVTEQGPSTVLYLTDDWFLMSGSPLSDYEASRIGAALSVHAIESCPTAYDNVR